MKFTPKKLRECGEKDFLAGKPIDAFFSIVGIRHTESERASYEIGWAETKRAQRKKNPSLLYFLRVQKTHGGPVMTWNGHSFSSDGGIVPHKAFSRADTAKRFGKSLVKKHPILAGYTVYVEPKFHTPATLTKKQRAMRGGSHNAKINPGRRKKNSVPRRNQAELDDAARLLEDFTGHSVSHLETGYSRSNQKTGLIVGELDVIGYRATRDGKSERYGHHFKKNSRPLLAVTTDGKQLHIVGGQYEFTEAGIEDR